MNRTKVVVIYGGKSAEHDVSLKTAFTVINALDRLYYEVVPIYISPDGVWYENEPVEGELRRMEELLPKRRSSPPEGPAASMGEVIGRVFAHSSRAVAFPVIHGPHGEDGTLQGLFELLNVPYVGNGVLASAVGMDKEMTKRILDTEGIPQASYVAFRLHDWEKSASACRDLVESKIGYPCYVKPANLGSSIGIHRCGDRREWMEAVEDALRYDHKVVVEREVPGREVQVAVLGIDEPECSVAGEFVREPEFFDYDAKYRRGPLNMRIPASLTAEAAERVRDYALRAFRALNGSGLMRVDFFVTDENEVYLNEVNTFPGFTMNSMFPALWNRTNGMSYAELINRLIRHAWEQHARKQSISFCPPAISIAPKAETLEPHEMAAGKERGGR